MSELEIADLESPAGGLRKVLTDLTKGIKNDLDALPDNSATRIHDIRVRSKKLWSLSKLARRHSEKALTRELKHCLRGIKNSFSGSRDEEVMRAHLLRLLPGKHGITTCEAACLPVTGDKDEIHVSAKTIECAERLSLLVQSFDWPSLSTRDLLHRFARDYRAAQEAMAAAHAHSDDELMHDWRKCVKDVFYQACALKALPAAAEMIEPLDDLADTLGQHHDMAVLLAHLRRHETSTEAKSTVLKEKEVLERIAIEKGKDLLGRKASDLERALGT